jgi:hypothetical protein
MIFKDEQGFPLNETLDGMDSAMRCGIQYTFFNSVDPIASRYEISPGILVRHPVQIPANNPKNFTRDQMMCLVTALQPNVAKRVFWKTIKRFCFAQNTERDYVGTTKYPFPHIMNGGDPKDNGKLRMFDMVDPLFPHHIGHIARCTDSLLYYPIFLLGVPLLLLSCYFNKGGEQNQLQCMVKRAGPLFVKLYKKYNPSWKEHTRQYWDSKNEPEYADAIIEELK